MRNIYIQSTIISLLQLNVTILLIKMGFGIIPIIILSSIIIALNIFRTHVKMKKLQANFDVFGDQADLNYDEYIQSDHTVERPSIKKNLNEQDMKVFSEVTEQLRLDIQAIKKSMTKSKDIQDIMNDTGGNKALDVMFTSIHNEPERLTDISDFAYTNVPYLSKLIELHVETENQAFKNERSNTLLNQSKETITTLANEIVNDYLQYKNKDLDELEAHIQQTTKHIDQTKRRKGY